MNAKRVLIALAVGAVVGWTIFGVMVARVTTVERIGDAQSRERFEQVRSGFEDPSPRLSVGEGGELSWQPRPEGDVAEIESLRVLAYRGPVDGLVQVDVPLWFLRLNEPAIIVDERRPNGDHVLIWTEAADEEGRPTAPPGSPDR